MSFILGLTGSIATGKSTVSEYFSSLSYPVVDADVASREVVQPRQPGLQGIIDNFGADYVTTAGNLNRKKLGQLIFNDKEARLQLNDILHGHIREWILAEIKKLEQEGHELIILDVPLLYEASNYVSECDAVMVVYVSTEIQLDRLMARDNLTEEEARKRTASQLSIEEKAKKADILIDNAGSKIETYTQIDEWLINKGFQVLSNND